MFLIKAIVYNSKTGFTKEYAEILSKKINVPCYNLKEIKNKLNKNDKIAYLAWICAGNITGINKVKNKYNVICYGAVGAFPKKENYINTLVSGNGIEKEKLFYLRGGIDFNKLKGFNKFVVKIVGKALESKEKDNKELLKVFNEGASFVDEKNLEDIDNYLKTVF